MKFKPTIAKSIVSILGGIVLGIVSKILIEAKLNYCSPGEYCVEIYRAANAPALLIWIGGTALIYAIWSLATKE